MIPPVKAGFETWRRTGKDERMSHIEAAVRAAGRQALLELGRAGDAPFAAAVARFLQNRFPPHLYRVTSGIVSGDRDHLVASNHLLIVDAQTSPVLPVAERDGELVVADAVYGAVHATEVLDENSLKDALESIQRLKTLRRAPVVELARLQNPYFGAVVARSGLSGKELLDTVARLNQEVEFAEQIDVICVLNAGMLTFVEVDPDGSITIELPIEASARWRLGWMPLGEDSLLAFYLTMWQTLASRSLRSASTYPLLRMLSRTTSMVLTDPHGIDRGE